VESTQKCIQKSGLLSRLFTINHTGTLIDAMAHHGLNSPVNNTVRAKKSDLDNILVCEILTDSDRDEVLQKVNEHTGAFMNSNSSHKRNWFTLDFSTSSGSGRNKISFLNSTLSRITLLNCSQLCELFHDEAKIEKLACKYIVKSAKDMKDNVDNPRGIPYFQFADNDVKKMGHHSLDFFVGGPQEDKSVSYSIDVVACKKLVSKEMESSAATKEGVENSSAETSESDDDSGDAIEAKTKDRRRSTYKALRICESLGRVSSGRKKGQDQTSPTKTTKATKNGKKDELKTELQKMSLTQVLTMMEEPLPISNRKKGKNQDSDYCQLRAKLDLVKEKQKLARPTVTALNGWWRECETELNTKQNCLFAEAQKCTNLKKFIREMLGDNVKVDEVAAGNWEKPNWRKKHRYEDEEEDSESGDALSDDSSSEEEEEVKKLKETARRRAKKSPTRKIGVSKTKRTPAKKTPKKSTTPKKRGRDQRKEESGDDTDYSSEGEMTRSKQSKRYKRASSTPQKKHKSKPVSARKVAKKR